MAAAASSTFHATRTSFKAVLPPSEQANYPQPRPITDSEFEETVLREFKSGGLHFTWNPKSEKGRFTATDLNQLAFLERSLNPENKILVSGAGSAFPDASDDDRLLAEISFVAEFSFVATCRAIFDLILSKSQASDPPPIFITQTYEHGTDHITALNGDSALEKLAQKVESFSVEGEWRTAEIATVNLGRKMYDAALVSGETCKMTVPVRMLADRPTSGRGSVKTPDNMRLELPQNFARTKGLSLPTADSPSRLPIAGKPPASESKLNQPSQAGPTEHPPHGGDVKAKAAERNRNIHTT